MCFQGVANMAALVMSSRGRNLNMTLNFTDSHLTPTSLCLYFPRENPFSRSVVVKVYPRFRYLLGHIAVLRMWMRPVVMSSVVCQCVCHSSDPCKNGFRTSMGPGNHLFDEGPDPSMGRGNFEGERASQGPCKNG